VAERVEAGLSFEQEGPNARASCEDGRSYLFLNQTSAEMLEAYRNVVSSARERLRPRFESFRGDNLDEAEFRGLTREAALDFLYVAVINGLSRVPRLDEWDHTASRRVVRHWVERRFRRKPAHARVLAAHLMALSLDEYDAFLLAEERYANR
jgi:hypothetical protein